MQLIKFGRVTILTPQFAEKLKEELNRVITIPRHESESILQDFNKSRGYMAGRLEDLYLATDCSTIVEEDLFNRGLLPEDQCTFTHFLSEEDSEFYDQKIEAQGFDLTLETAQAILAETIENARKAGRLFYRDEKGFKQDLESASLLQRLQLATGDDTAE